jgi:hypothetical protein
LGRRGWQNWGDTKVATFSVKALPKKHTLMQNRNIWLHYSAAIPWNIAFAPLQPKR